MKYIIIILIGGSVSIFWMLFRRAILGSYSQQEKTRKLNSLYHRLVSEKLEEKRSKEIRDRPDPIPEPPKADLVQRYEKQPDGTWLFSSSFANSLGWPTSWRSMNMPCCFPSSSSARLATCRGSPNVPKQLPAFAHRHPEARLIGKPVLLAISRLEPPFRGAVLPSVIGGPAGWAGERVKPCMPLRCALW